MNAELILTLITLATKTISGVTELLAKGNIIMSETDAKRIKAALVEARAATEAMRPRVDAALDAAAKR